MACFLKSEARATLVSDTPLQRPEGRELVITFGDDLRLEPTILVVDDNEDIGELCSITVQVSLRTVRSLHGGYYPGRVLVALG